MNRIAVFPGSFDPFTNGHKNIVERALPLFDTIIIAIGVNTIKHSLFTVDERIAQIKEVFTHNSAIQVIEYKGLTIDFCKSVGAQCIIRGVRNSTDFEYENAIAQVNREISAGIETIMIPCDVSLSAISSTIVRDLIKYGRDVSDYIPFNLVTKND